MVDTTDDKYDRYELAKEDVDYILSGIEVEMDDGQKFGIGDPEEKSGFTCERSWDSLFNGYRDDLRWGNRYKDDSPVKVVLADESNTMTDTNDGYDVVEFTKSEIDEILHGDFYEKFLDEDKTEVGVFEVKKRGNEHNPFAVELEVWSGLRNRERDEIFLDNVNVKVVIANNDDFGEDDEDDSNTMSFGRDTPEVAGSDMQSISDENRTHVTMEVTVDVRDMDGKDTEAIAKLARQFEESFEELYEKNNDYSWSFLTSGAKLAQSTGTPFDSVTRSQAFGLLTRLGDKHERLVENVYGNGSQEVSDPPHVTAKEASNYYHLLAFVLENPQLAQELAEI